MKMRILCLPLALLAILTVVGCGPGVPGKGGNGSAGNSSGQVATPVKIKGSAESLEDSKKLLAMSVDKWAAVLNESETKAQLADLSRKVKVIEGLEASFIKAKNDGSGDAEKLLSDYTEACVATNDVVLKVITKLRPKERLIKDVMDLSMIVLDANDREKLVNELETLTKPFEPLKDPLRDAGKFLIPLNDLIDAEAGRVKPGEKTADHYGWAAKTVLEKKAMKAKSEPDGDKLPEM